MIPLIICSIIFIILLVILIITEKGFWNIVGANFTLLLLLSIIYGIVMFVGRMELKTSTKFITYEYKELPIQSLINKSGVSVYGSFVLGSGSIRGGNNDYYVAYSEFPQGLLRVKVDASNSYIKETDDESPKIINYWAKKVWIGYENKWFWNSAPRKGEWEENKYGEKIVIVPKNTVYKDIFKIED